MAHIWAVFFWGVCAMVRANGHDERVIQHDAFAADMNALVCCFRIIAQVFSILKIMKHMIYEFLLFKTLLRFLLQF
jgi:hypothetical protein